MDKILFLYKFIKSPRSVGSITPSSRFLARAMTKPVDWNNARYIVELGAGTGIITKYIEAMKHPDCKAVIFERDNEMRIRLERMYPSLYYRSNAVDLNHALSDLGIPHVDCILSGLPFANFPQDLRDQITEGVFKSLKPGGMFVTFQYSLQMKNQLTELFGDVKINYVPFNIPPAFVYYCTKPC